MADIKTSVLTLQHVITRKVDTANTEGDQRTVTSGGGDSLNDTTGTLINEGDVVKVTMAGATQTVDLTALTTVGGRTVSLSGKKFRHVHFKAAPGNNMAGMTLGKGASNGFVFNTGVNWLEGLEPGQSIAKNCAGLGAAVGGSAKNIDLTGTSGDILYISFSSGT